MDFTIHDTSSAPADARPFLEKSQASYGFVPNLHGVMAESPALLEAYRTVSEIFDKTSLNGVERNVVLLTISYENGCTYCMAAHSTIATMQKVPEDVVAALRNGTPIADTKLEALRQFTSAVVNSRGWPDQAVVDALLAAGYGKAQILDVILGVGLKTMSNYTNHLADTPADSVFQSQAWSRAAE